MNKNFLIILTFVILAGCTVLEQPNQSSIGSVIYETQVSKKTVQNNEYSNTPKITNKSAILRKDCTYQIKYVTIKGLKKHKGEFYYYIENTVDTVYSNNINSNYVETEHCLSGNFTSPKKKIQFTNFTDHGIELKMDGSCIYTWTSHCSDSPCSTTRQNKGEYKYINDTLIVTYFLHRFFGNNMSTIENNTIKTINDAEWRVIDPVILKYNLSTAKDTLFALDNSRYSQVGTKWIINDTIKLLSTKTKLHN